MKNKKKILIMIFIIINVVCVSSCVGSSEFVVDNVAGVDNVKLAFENFTSAYIEGGDDYYHAMNGDLIVKYYPTGNKIRFSNITNTYDETSFFSDTGYVYNDSESITNQMTIAGIKGYHTNDVIWGDSFFFVMNDKIYMIMLDDGYLSENLLGIEGLLNAWLKASGYKQTWDYP
jgi:hypothetical protein